MSEQPSYSTPPGQRWGTGAASVLSYLVRDLAQKPTPQPTPAPSPRQH